MRILRVHHITLAVRDLEQARGTFEALFGVSAADAVAVRTFGIRTRDVRAGEDVLQLASPLEVDTALMRFIERRGEGVYNIALEVDDLDAAVAELAARGVRVSEPVEATPGLRSAFITMSATHGMSVQLVEPNPPTPLPSGKGENIAAEMDRETETAIGAGEDLTPGTAGGDERPEAVEGAGEGAEPPPKRAIDLTPDEWDIEEWSDTD